MVDKTDELPFHAKAVLAIAGGVLLVLAITVVIVGVVLTTQRPAEPKYQPLQLYHVGTVDGAKVYTFKGASGSWQYLVIKDKNVAISGR